MSINYSVLVIYNIKYIDEEYKKTIMKRRIMKKRR